MKLADELKYLSQLLDSKLISNQSVGERLAELAKIEKDYPLTKVTSHATFRGEPLCDCDVLFCPYPWQRRKDADTMGFFDENISRFDRPESHVQYKKDLQKRIDAEMSRVELVFETKKTANDKWYNARCEQIREMK